MFKIIEQNFIFYHDNNFVQMFVNQQLIIILHKFDHDETNKNYVNNANL